MAPLALTSKNWMAGIPDRTRLFDLYLPGTHDTATGYFDRRVGDFEVPNSDIGLVPSSGTMTQDKHATYTTQLENGIRFFDLRFRKEKPSIEYYQLYHSYFLATNLGEAVKAARDFLEKHPTETIFISLQPDKAADYNIISPAMLSSEVFNAYKTNSTLSDYTELKVSQKLNFTANPNNLWIEGYNDFEAIRQLRPYRGLGGLDQKFNLTTNYNSNLPIPDPKQYSPVNETDFNKRTYPPKLDYSGLAIGDVRGKIILVESNFYQYPGWNWSEPGSGIDPLDVQGNFSTGRIEQNNWEAPGYEEKKDAIIEFAKRSQYTKFIPDGADRALPLNYTSASQSNFFNSLSLKNAPNTFALVINAGLRSDGYKTDGTDTIASLLNRKQLDNNARDGDLLKYNLQQKLQGSSAGLKGVMLGDFYTTPYSWYNEFWDHWYYTKGGSRPNVNSGDYSQSSDWLIQKIWRQSAILTPLIQTSVKDKDSLTGLPVVKEGGSLDLSWNDYAGFAKPYKLNSSLQIFDGTSNWSVQYKVTQVDGTAELGLVDNDLRQKGLSNSTLLIKDTSKFSQRSFRQLGGPPQFKFTGSGSQIQKGFDYLSSSSAYLESFNVAATPGIQGDRFFRVDLMATKDGASWNAIGVPSYFLVTDA
jgi:hypothetical protein